MSDPNIYLDGTGNFNALTKNAGTIKYGTFNNAASNTGVIAVSAIFTGTAVNSGVIGNILPINTANLVASNSAAWESTYHTVADLSAEWAAGGSGDGGAADLTAISDVSATWDAAATFVSLNSSILVDTNDARLSDARTPVAHTQAISTIDGLQAELDAKQASGSYAAASHAHAIADVTDLQSNINSLSSAIDAKQASGSYAAASHTHTSSDITGFASDVAALIDTAAGDTIASLVNGKVPSIQLPSYVDDVVEEINTNNFPATGETGKIYVATSSNKTYRWSGSTYVEISPSPGSSDAVVEGSTNLYFTDARATSALQSTVDALSAAIDAAAAPGDFAAADDERLVLVGTNSASWNSVYSTVQGSSATWNAGGGGGGGSAEGISAYTTVNATSAKWSNSYTTLTANSASWSAAYTVSSSNSASWTSSYTTVNTTSARWNSSYTTLTATSASWSNTYTTLTASSARWNSSYNTLTATSATWSAKANASHTHAISDVTNLQTSLDAKASSTDARITLVGTNSANWNSSYNTLTATSATWSAKANASHTHTSADVTDFNTAADARIAAAAGVSIATLVGGTIPSAQLPSYVDDVLEYTATANFPATGSTGIIYVATGTNKTYRWSGSAYVEIAASPGSTDSVTEGSVNLYFTNARATAALQTTVNSLSSAIDGKQASGSYASATDARITLVGTNSANWNNSYTTLTSNSATWSAVYTTSNSNSANWNNSYTTLTANSATWSAVYTTSNSNSASWSSAYTVVNANSATWSAASTSTPSFSSLTTGGVTLLSAMLSTFTAPVTASGDFIVITVGTKKRLIRLWDNT